MITQPKVYFKSLIDRIIKTVNNDICTDFIFKSKKLL